MHSHSSPDSPRPTVRDAVFRLFREFGIDTVFGNPGSTELAMFRDFPEDFRYVLGLQESVVVGMADGYAQASGNAALVNLHSAVGVGHAMGNIFTAFRNQTPMVITVGQQARSMLPFDPFLGSTQPTLLPQPYVKWACEPARGEDVPWAMARAYRIAMQAPRGPVLVSVPADDWDLPSEWVPPRHVSPSRAPVEGDIDRLAQALDAARCVKIVVGAGVDRDRAVEKLVSLAERHQAQVYVAPMSARCSFPERHPLFAGFLPAIREQIVERLDGADLVLVLGAPAFSYHVEGNGPHVPEGAALWQVVDNPDVSAWTPLGNAIVSSLDLALDALLARSAPPARSVPAPFPSAPAVEPSLPLSTAYALQALDRVRPQGIAVVEEAPGARSLIQRYLPMSGANSFYTMASGGLGYSMPASVGVALAQRKAGRNDRVIALIGDGSSMYSIQALWTAAQLQLPISFIILNNRRYAALQDFAPVFAYPPGVKPEGTDLPDLDFVRLAQGQGLTQASRVETAEALEQALPGLLSAEGPNLLEIVVK
ncbi:benzoylformate decarboxylase [Kerstersia gyiorum]|uniref:Benzoylformate decarboxylase n=1 Tax=Kerstersia gyiorum TaxID=206506 RepID=A0A171KPW1_9BURK|nr:benzoylformate decarboxylase [Kerstersia gyiorum]KAB0544252.1 benzoylformate decarboxylase [Kerstersia gyiorum]KKO70928.1 benzoylformate decarboxylase [Kerstersia gyiorum]QBR39226.1 benzoylformate decarboxylase [Kerstersia gyiorum]RZS73018.1 benzoylformate decarboxylase [Kerstersia gyiorum]